MCHGFPSQPSSPPADSPVEAVPDLSVYSPVLRHDHGITRAAGDDLVSLHTAADTPTYSTNSRSSSTVVDSFTIFSSASDPPAHMSSAPAVIFLPQQESIHLPQVYWPVYLAVPHTFLLHPPPLWEVSHPSELASHLPARLVTILARPENSFFFLFFFGESLFS